MPRLAARVARAARIAVLPMAVADYSVGGYDLYTIASPFKIQGNHIGVGLDNTSNLIAGSTDGEDYGSPATIERSGANGRYGDSPGKSVNDHPASAAGPNQGFHRSAYLCANQWLPEEMVFRHRSKSERGRHSGGDRYPAS